MAPNAVPHASARVSRLADIPTLLRNGRLPHADDHALWPWCFMKEMHPADATVLEIWIKGASPTATPAEKNKLDKMLGRFTEMAEWSASVEASLRPSRVTPEALVDLLERGFMPPADAYTSAYAALSLPLTTEQATLVHSYVNGAARGASASQRRDLVSLLSKRWSRTLHIGQSPASPAHVAGVASMPGSESPAASATHSPVSSSRVPIDRVGPPEVARTVEALRKLLAQSPAAAMHENKWRHFPLPLSDEGAARLLYQAVVGASITGANVRDMVEAARMEQCAEHLEVGIDEAEREGLIDAGNAVAMRQALPRVRTAIGLIKEFPSALGMQLWFFGQALTLSAESRRPGAEQTSASIETLAGPFTHWVHHLSTDLFIKKGFLDVQLRMIERAADVGLISRHQRKLVLDRVAEVLNDFHDWDGGSEPFVRTAGALPRVSVYPSNPQMVMQRLRAEHGFDDERLDRLRDDIQAHVADEPGSLDSVAFYRKYSACLAGGIGCPESRRAYRVLALAIHQALTGAFS